MGWDFHLREKGRQGEVGQESVKVKREKLKKRKWIVFPVMAVLVLMVIGVAWLVKGRKTDGQQSGTGSIVEIVTDRHRGQGVVFAIEEDSGEIFILTAGHVMEGTEVGETVRISTLTDVSKKVAVSGGDSENGEAIVTEGDSTGEGSGASEGIEGDSMLEGNSARDGGANEGIEGDSVAENGDTAENGKKIESGTMETRLVYRSETADLAILSVRQEEAGGNLNCVKRDRAAFDAVSEGDSVQARYLERSGGELREAVQQGTLTYTWVYLEDFGLNMMVAELPAKSGMSGCGIFSAQGDFLGILCGVSAEGEAAILPLSVIESEWLLK